MIPYGRQEISEDDIEAVVDGAALGLPDAGAGGARVRASGGRPVAARAHAVAVNSATARCTSPAWRSGVGPGDWVWTSPITFVASAPTARCYCGADVDFVDIDPRTYNMSVDGAGATSSSGAERDRHACRRSSSRCTCAGQSCDMAAIDALAGRYGFRIIEDASHAIGGRYRGEPVGDCRYSDITVFSFHPVKIITTGEGGMALTNDAALAARMRLLRSHGITRDAGADARASADGAWYYEQIELGFNYRMTDMQAALGASQMSAARRVRRPPPRDRRPLRRGARRPAAAHSVAASGHLVRRCHLYVIRLELSATCGKRTARCSTRCAAAGSASTCTTSRSTGSPTTRRWASRRLLPGGRALLRRGDQPADVSRT